MNIGVIGLGKLGLPLLAVLAKAGHQVWGYDVSSTLVSKLQRREFDFKEPLLAEYLAEYCENFVVTKNLDAVVQNCELICVIVPTPSDETGRFKNDHVIAACMDIAKAYSNFAHPLTVNIVSTVMPGSCDGIIGPVLEKFSGKKFDSDFGLTYNPEFIALGSVIHDMQFPDMHLLGSNRGEHAERVKMLLSSIVEKEVPLKIMNCTEAELVKLAVNNFVTFKITFANMLGDLAGRFENVDVDVVTSALGMDSRIGSKYLKAGTPYGGPCFPRDTKALAAILKEFGNAVSLPETVDQMNLGFFGLAKSTVEREVEPHTVIAILGLSYKPFTDVTDESTGMWLLKELSQNGYSVFGWDPLVRNEQMFKEHKTLRSLQELLNKADLFVITRSIPDMEPELSAKLPKGKKIIDLWRHKVWET